MTTTLNLTYNESTCEHGAVFIRDDIQAPGYGRTKAEAVLNAYARFTEYRRYHPYSAWDGSIDRGYGAMVAVVIMMAAILFAALVVVGVLVAVL